MKQKTKIFVGAALLIYGIFHGYWRESFNNEQFKRGLLDKDDWVLNSAQIDLEQLLIIGIGVLFLAVASAIAMGRTKRIKEAEQAADGDAEEAV